MIVRKKISNPQPILSKTLRRHNIDHIYNSLCSIPITVGVAIPLKATFFITYIMVDGWSGVAAEILRVKPLIMYHLKNTFIVKTEQDRQKAMDPGSLEFSSSEPRIQFYFLLGLVYSAVTPILLPFIVIFFGFAYVVFRHQVWRPLLLHISFLILCSLPAAKSSRAMEINLFFVLMTLEIFLYIPINNFYVKYVTFVDIFIFYFATK